VRWEVDCIPFFLVCIYSDAWIGDLVSLYILWDNLGCARFFDDVERSIVIWQLHS
jgi:hypothetical protein